MKPAIRHRSWICSSSAMATRRRERGKFERDARRLTRVLFEASPFKERQRDINVWGLAACGAAVGDFAPLTRDPPALSARRDLRRVRFRAICAHVREQGVPRPCRERALRRRRDPGRTARRTAAAAFSGCSARSPPTAPGRRICSFTSSATTSPASPTSTTRRMSPICRLRLASSPGNQTSRPCSIPRR